MSILAFERGSEWVNWLFPCDVSLCVDVVHVSVNNPIKRQQAKDSKLALKQDRKCQYLDRKLLLVQCRSVSYIFVSFDISKAHNKDSIRGGEIRFTCLKKTFLV